MEEKMKVKPTAHLEEIVLLKRIEGQIRGIQKMIEEKRYCIDILTQLTSVAGAVRRVEENILRRHLRGCVHESFSRGSKQDRVNKIEEIINVLQKFRRR